MLSIRNLACFSDVSSKKSSSGKSISVLDGIRGFAALFVLADHTGVIASGQGGYGVIIFFCLSGFLLTQPFLNGKMWKLQEIASYFSRRLLRLLPMYFAYILIAAWYFNFGGNWLFNHSLFIKSDWHLWTIKQELIFYILLPAIMMMVFLFKANPLIRGGILLYIAYYAAKNIRHDVFTISGIQGQVMLHITPFIIGMAMAYFSKYLRSINTSFVTKALPSTLITFALLFMALTFSAISVGISKPNLIWENTFLLGFIYGGFIVWLVILPTGNLLYRFMNLLPLRAVGIVGYSFYLLHWIIKEEFTGLRDIPILYFAATAIATYAASCITYSLIEKPFIKLWRK